MTGVGSGLTTQSNFYFGYNSYLKRGSDELHMEYQGIRIDRDLVMQVDELINQEWHIDEQTFWRLNCPVYAGAVVVEGRSRKSPGQQNLEQSRLK